VGVCLGLGVPPPLPYANSARVGVDSSGGIGRDAAVARSRFGGRQGEEQPTPTMPAALAASPPTSTGESAVVGEGGNVGARVLAASGTSPLSAAGESPVFSGGGALAAGVMAALRASPPPPAGESPVVGGGGNVRARVLAATGASPPPLSD